MAHVTSLRLPDELFEQLTPLIRRRGTTLNAFVTDIIRRTVQAEQDREMYETGTILGEDADSDVNFAFPAQSDVVLKG